MPDRLLVDLAADQQVTVSTLQVGGLPEVVSRARLEWPLDDDALEDLRWYLEDYLRAPFGVYEDRGPAIQQRLNGWGEQVFASVFGSGPAWDAYRLARDQGLELMFRSAAPGLLGLPWELMRDDSGPVALNLAGVSRSLPVAEQASAIALPAGRLRVLMVISRPAGTGDVGYRMIARPLLERLEKVRGEVDLTVLRPPTLYALQNALKAAADDGAPFSVVHFDGHGSLRNGREGFLALEHRFGGSHHVAASQLAVLLNEGRIPLVVLNACQSGAVGKDLEAAFATALLRTGCASVVAMAYSVYAIAAAEFMAAFYEALFVGAPLGVAVTAGRRRMFENNGRPSPKGALPLADWLVPVHYLRSDIALPQARTRPAEGSGAPSLDTGPDQVASQRFGIGPETSLDPVGVFTGRDDLFYELESKAWLKRVVVLYGPGGTGKTELAKGFGRWWQETGGVDGAGCVFWYSFEPGIASVGLDSVVMDIGLAVYGADIASLDAAERLEKLKELLAQRRLLLIWDNFETVKSMPNLSSSTRPVDERGCKDLAGFLTWLAGYGRSAVLITSRNREDWLGPMARIHVGGPAREEAAEYASYLLAPYPSAARKRGSRSFGELLDWLAGHPLSMRLTLPRAVPWLVRAPRRVLPSTASTTRPPGRGRAARCALTQARPCGPAPRGPRPSAPARW